MIAYKQKRHIPLSEKSQAMNIVTNMKELLQHLLWFGLIAISPPTMSLFLFNFFFGAFLYGLYPTAVIGCLTAAILHLNLVMFLMHEVLVHGAVHEED